jgi:hypothetical protein
MNEQRRADLLYVGTVYVDVGYDMPRRPTAETIGWLGATDLGGTIHVDLLRYAFGDDDLYEGDPPYGCGLRQGEALALRWQDIDFDGDTLRVTRQLQRMRRDGKKSGRLVFSEPKNASRRIVGLPKRAVSVLKTHRKRQLEEKLGAGPLYR